MIHIVQFENVIKLLIKYSIKKNNKHNYNAKTAVLLSYIIPIPHIHYYIPNNRLMNRRETVKITTHKRTRFTKVSNL